MYNYLYYQAGVTSVFEPYPASSVVVYSKIMREQVKETLKPILIIFASSAVC